MKKLFKIYFVIVAVVALSSCRKTEFASVIPSSSQDTHTPAYKSFHETGSSDGSYFVDKDKCKKCHTGSRTMGIIWQAPYMSDNSYSNLEELVNNYDFVNNVHLKKNTPKEAGVSSIPDSEKAALLNYLKTFETAPAVK